MLSLKLMKFLTLKNFFHVLDHTHITISRPKMFAIIQWNPAGRYFTDILMSCTIP